ncbi:lipid II:glycine glycyltransferase FemX [Paenactinomyces guangxiensis]|uniref:Lipid II:glycine glycyltransferase n=1 Tax=Paenactinomyces guangxiensis TaxID=1490290 RepID=A0A7W1WUG5_9BACL|nr:peptidoglycan bridge formation glycyltransferase FemA/FemB family protein [Paenactinomyces guangxiensis]MBA4496283.1 peptidoglycan bridge formation glycyltransferase FemA/FemB family protein [Paenactinomyces guangxiensis]MBH8593336.1 peptidoglycan bridge formation glycyltransferase FemA/FemB family protein [Paenactinomyces guangxiensis]
MSMLTVSLIEREDYLNFVETQSYRNFLQYPSWADLKGEWKWSSEFLGWITSDGTLVGGAVVLYRKVPGLNKFLAYIPRGPIIDWFSEIELSDWFQPLFHHLKQRHVFSVKIDPPLVSKTWSAQRISQNIKDFQSHGLKNKKLTDILPDRIFNDVEYIQQELAEMGWRKNTGKDSFDTVQPQYVFRLNMNAKSLEQIFSEFDPQWQQQISRAEQEGVEIQIGTEQDLPDFHRLLVYTGQREQTQVRDLSYFEKMFESLIYEDPHRLRLYLAKQGEELLSSAIAIRVNGHTWDLYSAKKSDKPDDPSVFLLRWKMIQDSYHQGDRIYDFRGISTTLNEDDPLFELLQFKMGFNGDACELMGEWDYPVIPMLHWAFDLYMKKR